MSIRACGYVVSDDDDVCHRSCLTGTPYVRFHVVASSSPLQYEAVWLPMFQSLPSLSSDLFYVLDIVERVQERGHFRVTHVHACKARCEVGHDTKKSLSLTATTTCEKVRCLISHTILDKYACCNIADANELLRHRCDRHSEILGDERLWLTYAERLLDPSEVFFHEMLGVPCVASGASAHTLEQILRRFRLDVSTALPSLPHHRWHALAMSTMTEAFEALPQLIDKYDPCELVVSSDSMRAQLKRECDLNAVTRRTSKRCIFVDGDRCCADGTEDVELGIVLHVFGCQPFLLPAHCSLTGWSLASLFATQMSPAPPAIRDKLVTKQQLSSLMHAVRNFVAHANHVILVVEQDMVREVRSAYDNIKTNSVPNDVAAGYICVGDLVHELHSNVYGVVLQIETPTRQTRGTGTKRLRGSCTDLRTEAVARVHVRFDGDTTSSTLVFAHNFSWRTRLVATNIEWWLHYAGGPRDRVAVIARSVAAVDSCALFFAHGLARDRLCIFTL